MDAFQNFATRRVLGVFLGIANAKHRASAARIIDEATESAADFRAHQHMLTEQRRTFFPPIANHAGLCAPELGPCALALVRSFWYCVRVCGTRYLFLAGFAFAWRRNAIPSAGRRVFAYVLANGKIATHFFFSFGRLCSVPEYFFCLSSLQLLKITRTKWRECPSGGR